MSEVPDYRKLKIAEGLIWSERCPACNERNGVRIDGPNLPPFDPKAASKLCVWCEKAKTVWEPIGVSEETKLFETEEEQ